MGKKDKDETITVESSIRHLMTYIGEDPERDGLLKTPDRIKKSWKELFSGYKVDVKDLFKTFEEPTDELVLLKGIEFYSTCEHHWLPFMGTAHVAYIPNHNKVIGVSKLARLVDAFSRRLQIQERIGRQVVAALDENLESIGSACIIEAKHLCMCCRGVNKQNSVMVTSSLSGAFKEEASARAELLQLIRT